MTEWLVASIAALLLATGAAHAGTQIFDCKDVLVEHFHLSDQEDYRIDIIVEHKSKKRPPIVTFDPKNETLTVNGKRCKRTEEKR